MATKVTLTPVQQAKLDSMLRAAGLDPSGPVYVTLPDGDHVMKVVGNKVTEA